MKKSIFLIFLLACISCQLIRKPKPIPQTSCDSLFFDLEIGMINNISPILTQDEIKEWYPCYTGFVPHGSSDHCGGGVLFANHDFYYYTYMDFLEVRQNFKGKISNDLMGKSKEVVRNFYGTPVDTKFKTEQPEIDFFKKDYGCLQIDYKENKVVKISAHYYECDNIEICF